MFEQLMCLLRKNTLVHKYITDNIFKVRTVGTKMLIASINLAIGCINQTTAIANGYIIPYKKPRFHSHKGSIRITQATEFYPVIPASSPYLVARLSTSVHNAIIIT